MPAIFPLVTKGGGKTVAFPDVCLVPAGTASVPTPFLNTADAARAIKPCRKIRVCKKRALKLDSEMPRSTGDTPSNPGGVASGMKMGKVIYMSGSQTVSLEGKPAVYLTSSTQQNQGNAAGLQVDVKQKKVIIGP